jgi:dTDP-4-dehydrorhamnose reductase
MGTGSKVLITGANGQVGRALLKTVPSEMTTLPLTRAELDIGDEQAVLNCIQSHRPDLIINTAAYTAVDRAESEPQLAERGNSLGPRYLAVAAAAVDARLRPMRPQTR